VGLLDMFGGGSPAQKALKLKPKISQKYGDPTVRQKAISQVAELRVPEAVQVLLSRFTIAVEPQSTDAYEKDQVFELIKEMGREAVQEPVTAFLKRTDTASSWALRILEAVMPSEELLALVVGYLQQLSGEYTRDPEKKIVLLQWVSGKSDPRIGPAAVPYLEDAFDDVKIAATKVLAPLKFEPAREPLLALLTGEETARRVQTAALATLHESEFGVQGYREKVEKLLVEPYFIDRAGVVKKRT